MHKATWRFRNAVNNRSRCVYAALSMNKIEIYLGAAFSAFLEAIRPFGAEDNYHKKRKTESGPIFIKVIKESVQ